MELQVNGELEFNSKDFIYQTKSILDYSNFGKKVLGVFNKFANNSTSEIINGECSKEQDSSVFKCSIQLKRYSSPLLSRNVSFDYISKHNNKENKKVIIQKLFEHYKQFEDGLFQNSYIEKIRNKCFQQLSSYVQVFIPVSQVYEQKIVDQLIQNNFGNQIRVIHYFQGAKTIQEFEQIFNTTISQKYPLLTNQNVDMCFTDLRSQYVEHCFLGDIQIKEFAKINEPILKKLNELQIFGEEIDLLNSLTDCLNQEIPNYFQIVPKNNQINSKEIPYYSFESNKFIFNQQEHEMQSVKQQIRGDVQIINTQFFEKKDIRNKIFRITYKQNTIKFQSNQQQVCNDYLPVVQYSLENQIIDIVLGRDIQLDLKNKTISHEKKKQGIYLFTINLIQKQN
ncbi:hypothetical protein ABPG72_014543 [Tetrahymena utriculariae]